MRFFIVHAHHEPTSLSGALTREAQGVLQQCGHDVVVSDLYAMKFDPVSDRRNFLGVHNAERLKQQDEEAYASSQHLFAPDIQIEMDRLNWCDVLVLQFPLWWLGMPAILKGWVDRVFAIGFAYGGGRYFERGLFAGKRAMCSITTGGVAQVYSDIGIYGPISKVLYPIHHGVLGFVGFTVVDPFVVYAPTGLSEAQRSKAIEQYGTRLLCIKQAPSIPGPQIERYEGLILKSKIEK